MAIKKVDVLIVDTLEIGDIIDHNGIITITQILDIEEQEAYLIDGIDEWDEVVQVLLSYSTMVDFYYPVDDED